MSDLPASYTIEFTPCTGFGTIGRTASLRDTDNETIDCGHGATDEEAVLQALLGMGHDFDTAFDCVSTVLGNATRLVYTNCVPNS